MRTRLILCFLSVEISHEPLNQLWSRDTFPVCPGLCQPSHEQASCLATQLGEQAVKLLQRTEFEVRWAPWKDETAFSFKFKVIATIDFIDELEFIFQVFDSLDSSATIVVNLLEINTSLSGWVLYLGISCFRFGR